MTIHLAMQKAILKHTKYKKIYLIIHKGDTELFA